MVKITEKDPEKAKRMRELLHSDDRFLADGISAGSLIFVIVFVLVVLGFVMWNSL